MEPQLAITSASQGAILAPDEMPAATVERPDGAAPAVLVCEHASARIPRALGTLGLNDTARSSHIAWDPGALALARRLAAAFDAPLVAGTLSRLVYDCNRAPGSPSAIPQTSEIYDIPGNRGLTDADRTARMLEVYEPFRALLTGAIGRRMAAGERPALVTVHSFTPVYFGKPRDVEIGVLHAKDHRLADAVLDAAGALPFVVRRNEPYGPEDGVAHTLRQHGERNALPNVMLEVRNDLLRDAEAVDRIALALHAVLNVALDSIGLGADVGRRIGA